MLRPNIWYVRLQDLQEAKFISEKILNWPLQRNYHKILFKRPHHYDVDQLLQALKRWMLNPKSESFDVSDRNVVESFSKHFRKYDYSSVLIAVDGVDVAWQENTEEANFQHVNHSFKLVATESGAGRSFES
jgi:N-acetyl-anhydromuramyl-L-alanine amidase AmpD